MKDKRDAPIKGIVEFIQHNLPGLDAGEYKFEAAQQVGVTQGTNATQSESYGNSYYFAITGERFKLPTTAIDTTYPPANAEGAFNNSLPHVVLKNQSYPWSRFPTIAAPPKTMGSGEDLDVPTWLAVLLFTQTEINQYKLEVRNNTVKSLFKDPKQPNIASYFSWRWDDQQKQLVAVPDDQSSQNAVLNEYLDIGETVDDECRTIDIPYGLFKQLAPTIVDLMMMAHVRRVDILSKATQEGAPAGRNDLSRVPGTSTYAMVLGNRLPQSNQRHMACLVSLEGLQPYLPLPTGDGVYKDSSDPDKLYQMQFNVPLKDTDLLRLVCLQDWTFNSVGDDSQFEILLRNLQSKNGHTSDTEVLDYSIGLPIPKQPNDSTATMQVAINALKMGYTAMQHQTRDGGKTVSWYRGPLVPYQLKVNSLPPSLSSADSATRYDPTTGMFDISYSAAWQLGRLLALQDQHFALSVYTWRQKNLKTIVAELEAIVASQTLTLIEAQLPNSSDIYTLLRTFLPQPAASNSDGSMAQGISLAQTKKQRIGKAVELLSDPDAITQTMKDTLQVPVEIYSWLAKLKLLDGVPFNYLVPDDAMLPPESIRFFYLDMNWIYALIDGALSIGRNSGPSFTNKETAHDDALKDRIDETSTAHATLTRLKALGVEPPDPSGRTMEVVTGFVLRSDVVFGWPGLEVNGYTKDKDGNLRLMHIVRFERLAPTVLLCLFESNKDQPNQPVSIIDIHEPAEGLHFGAVDDPKKPGTKTIHIRYNYKTADDAHLPGEYTPVFFPIPFRQNTTVEGVVEMFALSHKIRIEASVSDYIHDIPDTFQHLPSSEFALQMIKGASLVSFPVS